MARTIPIHRFGDLVRAASATFIDRGFAKAQMADVAAAMGVGKGTLYGYVESKEALFALAFEHCDASLDSGFPCETPVPTPSAGALRALYLRRLREVGHFPVLDEALGQSSAADIGAEFDAVVRELFAVLHAHRVGVKLVNRCALEIPELGAIWHQTGRGAHLDKLVHYLSARTAAGQLHSFPDQRVAARLLLETVASWAVHLHWDPVPIPHDPEVAEATVLATLRRAFLEV